MPTMRAHLLFLPSLALTLSCQGSDPWARAAVMTDLTESVGGPKAMGRPGDIVLESDQLRFVILGARSSMGPHTSGGSVLDADLQRSDARYLGGHGNDQLAEIFSTVNLNVTTADESGGEVVILADGSDGGAAVVCVDGESEGFLTLLDLLAGFVGAPPHRIRTHYILEPGSPVLLMRTWAILDGTVGCENEVEGEPLPGSDTELPILDYALGGGLALGDFYLQGGSVDVFAPDIGFDEEGFVYELGLAGTNTFQDPIPADFIAGTGTGVSYAIQPVTGREFVPMFTSSPTVAVGAGISKEDLAVSTATALYFDRYLAVGRGDVGSAVDGLLEARGESVGRVQGFVVEEGTGISLSDISVFAYRAGADRPWNQWTTDVGDDPHPDGSFGGNLPVGEWELQVYASGRPKGVRVPVHITAGGEVQVVLTAPQPASIVFDVVDETGRPVPSKLSFFTVDGSDVRDPNLGDSYIGGHPAAVAFTNDGHGQVSLPPGDYFAVASRGIEYEIDVSEPFTVEAERVARLELQVWRSVDTMGWVASDFHVHSVPSHDSGVSLEDRVTTMVAEGMEFFSSTDHDAITDFAPTIEAMGMEEWVHTTVGLEVTTIELGHFLGFPLVHDYLSDNGGAVDWNGLIPQEIIDGIRNLGVPEGVKPVVFVGHPRDGILGYFDEYGLNTYEGSPGELSIHTPLSGFAATANPLLVPENFSTDFDALEMLNGKRFELIRTPTQPELDAYAADPDSFDIYDVLARTMEEQEALEAETMELGYGLNGPVDDWFRMLNLGFRYTLLGNSDTHGKTSVESGCPRNYVMADTDDPAFLDPDAIATAVREGHVVASYGPFIRFTTTDGANVGDTVQSSGPVTFDLEVQSPHWFDVDRVELYENGSLIDEWSIETPNADVLNLAEQVEVTPTQDSWYVLIALGRDSLDPVFTPVDIPPVQLQDVVSDALSGVATIGALLGTPIPIPRAYPVIPYAVTNPIFVVADGDGTWDPPGLPTWLREPVEPD